MGIYFSLILFSLFQMKLKIWKKVGYSHGEKEKNKESHWQKKKMLDH